MRQFLNRHYEKKGSIDVSQMSMDPVVFFDGPSRICYRNCWFLNHQFLCHVRLTIHILHGVILMLIQQTSRDAYASVDRGNTPMLHFVVLLIDQFGGLTCDDVEFLTGGKHQSISAAIRANVKKGLLRASGNYRMTRSNRRAIVWETTPIRLVVPQHLADPAPLMSAP